MDQEPGRTENLKPLSRSAIQPWQDSSARPRSLWCHSRRGKVRQALPAAGLERCVLFVLLRSLRGCKRVPGGWLRPETAAKVPSSPHQLECCPERRLESVLSC